MSYSAINFPIGKLPTSVGTAVGVTDGMLVGVFVAVGAIVAVETIVGSDVGVCSTCGAQAIMMSNKIINIILFSHLIITWYSLRNYESVSVVLIVSMYKQSQLLQTC